MMIIRNGEHVADNWRYLGEGEPLPETGDVILTVSLVEANRDAVLSREGRTGVVLPNTSDVAEIAPLLEELALVVLQFPSFTDGRAYSQSWQLRTRLDYGGELRARGEVLPDQAAFMIRVGFDSFEVDPGQSLDIWQQATRSITLAYQADCSGGARTRYQASSQAAS